MFLKTSEKPHLRIKQRAGLSTSEVAPFTRGSEGTRPGGEASVPRVPVAPLTGALTPHQSPTVCVEAEFFSVAATSLKAY